MKSFIATTFLLLSLTSNAQCTDYAGVGVNQGNMTFDGTPGTFQTTAVTSQDYWTVPVVCGNTYTFDFCGNGGSSGSMWTTITLLDGTTVLANAPYAGGCATLTWSATYTGNATVYVTDNGDGCAGAPAWSATMAYDEAPNTIAYNTFDCNTATMTLTGNTGGTYTFNPAPGDAAILNAGTGNITNGTPGATYNVDYNDPACGTTLSASVTLQAADPSFTLAVACGGGTSTITGSTGGTFTFNPAPSDGAQVDPTTGTITNGTAGTTYTIEYTVCGSSSTQSVTVLTDDCWTLNGDAQYITVGTEQCIQLTDEVNNQTGCAWSGSQIDFAQDFTLTLDYYFGDNIGGADGNTFTFQPSSSTACGQDGGQLGAGGLANALSIEFDTYDNDNPTHLYDMSCDHVAIEIDGDHQGPGAPLCGPECAKASGGNIDDGLVYQVDIEWIAATNTLNVYFDGALRLTCVNDFVTNAFAGTSQVYWGATSATGGLNNQQYFCPNTIVLLPAEMTSFTSECNGDQEIFTWTTASEHNTDYFELQYTYDGLVFYPVKTVDAMGDSQLSQSYTVTEELRLEQKHRYYRVKTVDNDGAIEYTDIISSKQCQHLNQLVRNIETTSNAWKVNVSKEVNYRVVNSLGKPIAAGYSENGTFTISTSTLAQGAYFLQVASEDITETTQLFVH